MIPIRGLRAPVPPICAKPEPERPTYGVARVMWTADMDAELRRRWSAGQTGTAIAEALGHGLTRNAVCARATRLKLERRQTIFTREGRWG